MVSRDHGFHSLSVKGVVQETDDSSSFVLEIPAELAQAFRYRAGQFCTFRVRVGSEEHLRSYSMSSAPETDPDLTVTVKRVPGGVVSNWLVDSVGAGDVLEVTKPAGAFCLRESSTPVIALCGGSGVTPVISIIKSALHSTTRPVRVLYANRTRDSVIFAAALEEMRLVFPSRLQVAHHFDAESGLVVASEIDTFVGDCVSSDFYICDRSFSWIWSSAC